MLDIRVTAFFFVQWLWSSLTFNVFFDDDDDDDAVDDDDQNYHFLSLSAAYCFIASK